MVDFVWTDSAQFDIAIDHQQLFLFGQTPLQPNPDLFPQRTKKRFETILRILIFVKLIFFYVKMMIYLINFIILFRLFTLN